MGKQKTFGGLDQFKIIAALLVIAIHTSPLASYNQTADFILTRIIARVAVPFFFMVTGYFLLPRYLFGKSNNTGKLKKFMLKTSLLYGAAIILYLPVNFYAGHFKGLGVADVFRLLLFDGTFYHLWYLPAAMLGVAIVFVLGKNISPKVALYIALALYIVGLFGDSYYGITEKMPWLAKGYEFGFGIFTYTRNGVFFAPVFLAMGAWLSQHRGKSTKGLVVRFALSFLAMVGEGLTLHHFKMQRHDSMYIALLPTMFFLFLLILKWRTKASAGLRAAATWVYILHPLCIIFVRGLGKMKFLANALSNSLLFYAVVCVLSFTFASGIVFALKATKKQKRGLA